MVAERTARDNAVLIDLRPLRAKIAWAAENYVGALLSTLPKGDEEWAKLVLEALQPMLATDGSRTKDSSTGSASDAVAAEAEPGGEPDSGEPSLLDGPGEQG